MHKKRIFAVLLLLSTFLFFNCSSEENEISFSPKDSETEKIITKDEALLMGRVFNAEKTISKRGSEDKIHFTIYIIT